MSSFFICPGPALFADTRRSRVWGLRMLLHTGVSPLVRCLVLGFCLSFPASVHAAPASPFALSGAEVAREDGATRNTRDPFEALGLTLEVQAMRVPAAFLAGLPGVASAAGQGEIPLFALSLTTPSGSYAYAQGANSGLPTELRLAQSMAPHPPTVLYPPGEDRPDLLEPGKRVLAYEGRFTLFVLPPPGEPFPASLPAELSLLVCTARSCTPVRQRLDLVFPPQSPLLGQGSPLVQALAAARPAAHPAFFELEQPGDAIRRAPGTPLDLGTLAGGGRGGSDANAALSPASIPAVMPQSALKADTGAERANAKPQPPSFAGQLETLRPRYTEAGLEPESLGAALLLGMLAGLILNVMPCVLPVLTIKVSALLHAAGEENPAQRLHRFREHNLCFAAGILTWFLCLALAVGGLDLAWGGLFQSPQIVYGLLILIFLLGLSLFDLFTLPVLDFKLKATGSPRVQAYLSGLMATLLATPCSGPLLGGVLGWTASRPLPVIFLVFAATGLGMSLPYLALALFPGAARALPRPGPWTGVMERLVGFFLLGTALYLLSILPETFRLSVLTALLVVALAAWVWGRWGGFDATFRRRLFARGLAFCLAGSAIWWSLLPPPPPPAWIAFAPDTFRTAVGNVPLLVEFTADWCPSCKALERAVLTPARLGVLQSRYGLKLIKVDLTRPDPEAEALLRALGSVSIPVTALFPAGPDAATPLVLRDLYTPSALEAAAQKAFATEPR